MAFETYSDCARGAQNPTGPPEHPCPLPPARRRPVRDQRPPEFPSTARRRAYEQR